LSSLETCQVSRQLQSEQICVPVAFCTVRIWLICGLRIQNVLLLLPIPASEATGSARVATDQVTAWPTDEQAELWGLRH
jgi:hypothetical protein